MKQVRFMKHIVLPQNTYQDMLNWAHSSLLTSKTTLKRAHNLRASSVGRPVLPATVTAGFREPEFGPTPSLPVPLVRESRQKSSRSRHFFRFWREHWSSRYCGIKRHPCCILALLRILREEDYYRKLSYKMLGAGGSCWAQGWTPLPPLPNSHSQGSLQTGILGASRGNGLRML